MNSLPVVSVVVPVYNGANFMRQAIDSALGQSYSNIEVIVVNDGSMDDGATRTIALSYGRSIRYLEKENGGVASALNAGIEAMKGEFFSWLSHDDTYYPKKIEQQLSFLQNRVSKRTIAFSHEDKIDEEGRIIERAIPYDFNPQRLYYELLYRRFIGGCSLLVPRKAFEDSGCFNAQYRTVQDYDLWFRMASHGYLFDYCPITSGASRLHPAQDSRTKIEIAIREKNDLLIRVQLELPESLWIDSFVNRARAFYKLAFQFGLEGLWEVRRFDLKMGDEFLAREPFLQRILDFQHRVKLSLRLKYRLYKRALKRALA